MLVCRNLARRRSHDPIPRGIADAVAREAWTTAFCGSGLTFPQLFVRESV
jgi:hypothetical protein